MDCWLSDGSFCPFYSQSLVWAYELLASVTCSSTPENSGKSGKDRGNGLSLRCCILLACLGKSFCWVTDSGLRNAASVQIKVCLQRERAKILLVYIILKPELVHFLLWAGAVLPLLFPLHMVYWILDSIHLVEIAQLVMAVDSNIHISHLAIHIWILSGWRGAWLEFHGQIT